MILRLSPLPETLRGPDDEAYKGRVPKRARFLEPAAATSLLGLVAKNPWLTFTDIYRSPEASLAAMRSKRGVKSPGFSGHNFGFSVDLDVGACLRGAKIKYVDLIDVMGSGDWYCHRRDLDPSDMESWHFNHLMDSARLLALADLDNHSTWALPVETKILEMYGHEFAFDDAELQRMLRRMGLYSGELDGKVGPITREAIRVFQRAWGLADDGVAGPRTRRVLAVVSAEIELFTVIT